ncbi:MAG: hypothetical protein AAB693_01405 [Patescibacteria group bacterium]
MNSTTKNTILFILITALTVLGYIFFIKENKTETSLVSSSQKSSQDKSLKDGENFLTLLLGIKDIKLDDAIFSEDIFSNLIDSSVNLGEATDIGKSNPFSLFENKEINMLEVNTTVIEKENSPDSSIDELQNLDALFIEETKKVIVPKKNKKINKTTTPISQPGLAPGFAPSLAPAIAPALPPATETETKEETQDQPIQVKVTQ